MQNLTVIFIVLYDVLQEEYESCTIRVATRTIQETKAPFENSIQRAGLFLLKEPEEVVFPCMATQLWRQKLERGMSTNDPALY